MVLSCARSIVRTARRCGASLVLTLFVASIMSPVVLSSPQERAPVAESQTEGKANRALYQINLALDFAGRSYTGTERVRWTNQDDHPASILYFHLYSNIRATAQHNSSTAAGNGSNPLSSPDEPRLEVVAVSTAAGAPLPFTLDDQATSLRVNLREPVAAGASTTIEIKFKGSVPEIDPEETGLFAHIVQQVGAAIRSEREIRRARDVNFRCRGVMLLGTFYPVLATREGNDWQRKVETSVGDMVFTEAADYRVTVDAPSDVRLFASGMTVGEAQASVREPRVIHEFAGENLRDFALVAGRTLRAEERLVGDVKVRSIYPPEHEKVARRVLAVATDAARVYVNRFGALPFKTISIVDAPLVAGQGSTEFAGLGAIASAFYVDFDAPQIRNLPEMIREQRASVEDSLEWTVAHVVAHQWWGAAVGNDPARDPVLDEALASWSALLYYREIHGEERAAAAMNDQLRGVYKVYRTFGGEDMAADRNAREYRNFFQYSAIVSSKGALMLEALHRSMGSEKFFAALKNYYNANLLEIAEIDDLRGAFIAEAPLAQRRAVARTLNRWLSSKRGDEDITPPDPQLAAALGLNPNPTKSGDGNRFARLGKFFWQQMTRIR